jgi:serine/threonine protein kinase
VLGQAVHKELSLVDTFKPTLQSKLLKARSPKDSRNEVLRFSGTYRPLRKRLGGLIWHIFTLLLLSLLPPFIDLLSKCLVLDPSKRVTVKAALQHDFFKAKSGNNVVY